MKSLPPRLAALVPLVLAGACAGSGAGPSGPRVTIQTAPLTLPAVAEVCFGLTVYNGAPAVEGTDVVWTHDPVCSGQYGNGAGGDIAFVGPCDADVPGDNYVALVLDTIEDVDGAILDDQITTQDGDADFENPCPASAPCVQHFACVENADVAVVFDLAVMRDAEQGFFDVAVNFEDIFCSAKLDCRYGDEPIALLFDPKTGARGQTAVLALACTAGAGDVVDTALFMTDVTVTCDGVEVTLDPSAGPGNVWQGGVLDPDPTDAIWQYATYRGVEALPCGEASCNKLYWNVAVGFDPTADCQISATATASASDLMTDFQTPPHATYPVIAYSATLSAEGALACSQNPLNGDGSGVLTHYTDIAKPMQFCHRLTADGVSSSSACGVDLAACDTCLGLQKELASRLDSIATSIAKADERATALGAPLVTADTSTPLVGLCQARVDAYATGLATFYDDTLARIDSDTAKANADLQATKVDIASARDLVDNVLTPSLDQAKDQVVQLAANIAANEAAQTSEASNRASQHEVFATRTQEASAWFAALAEYNMLLAELGPCNSAAPSLPSAPMQDLATMLSQLVEDLALQQSEADALQADRQVQCTTPHTGEPSTTQCETWTSEYDAATTTRNRERDIIERARELLAARLANVSSWLSQYQSDLTFGGGPQLCPQYADTATANRVTLGYDGLDSAVLGQLATDEQAAVSAYEERMAQLQREREEFMSMRATRLQQIESLTAQISAQESFIASRGADLAQIDARLAELASQREALLAGYLTARDGYLKAAEQCAALMSFADGNQVLFGLGVSADPRSGLVVTKGMCDATCGGR